MATPIVALQQPKDISLDEIESELGRIWLSENGGRASSIATRAATFSMVVYEPEEFQQLLGALGFYEGPIDGIYGALTKEAVQEAQITYGIRVTGRIDPETLIRLREEYDKMPPDRQKVTNPNARGFSISEAIAAQNPCRIITLCPVLGEDEGVTAQVSAYCPIQKGNSSRLICCEYITLRGTKQALQRVGDLVVSLMIPSLPKFVWWKATPNPEQELFQKLSESCNCMIMDSSYFSDPESEFLKMQKLIDAETYMADLNWHRLTSWQELAAAAFDPPERRASLVELDRVTIDYEKGNASQALMFLGWLASRLNWKPLSYQDEGGDYDIRRVSFKGPGDRTVEAELAAIPTADWGEINGDMVGLRLTSTNSEANCCTILCSETTGCMRMESGGSAQNCRTEQVTPLTDQKAEYLLGQQLQRWGRDMLYEESLSVTTEILKLRQ
ncbi:glucose-6-phosphate dehydrogenase assembly protein OpcA [Laspinema sp. A4]|uniref:glucose-6-phosphate dehydrogenase assembly protein OpcA n=1 Tax=Laspinema sp. D2d TaxID=2953686 RepID=UPI0021BA6574|nr:glucose-6-phosphate dehydrogenase assembly protein OpcA [Laspinema sp. D2d]MCT7983158.1 glucose-6-phosphate dehydrogenase assembly protein OpcA [Laspinema sp. D2d]